jgi:hypothetical protein
MVSQYIAASRLSGTFEIRAVSETRGPTLRPDPALLQWEA